MTRLFEALVSAAALVLLLPLLGVIALLVRVSSPGPILHRGKRVGRDGVLFNLYKFRSMRVGTAGPGITRAGDTRITAIGAFLRRTKLDELPQLVNVLRGDMGLVGARPEDPDYVAKYDETQRRILRWRPGITSPASLTYRDEESLLTGDDWERTYVETIMPAKLRLDLKYMERRSLRRDVKVILQTVKGILGP